MYNTKSWAVTDGAIGARQFQIRVWQAMKHPYFFPVLLENKTILIHDIDSNQEKDLPFIASYQ
jgi:hypothetical protein